MYWRRPFHRDQSFDNVLYTICADNKLRIWAPAGDHGLSILHLWADINLKDSIQPRSLDPRHRSDKRYAFIIDNRDFTAATERVVQNASSDEQAEPGMAHLIEVATKSPDVCVVLDDRGNMSAWGLESVGCKHRKPGDIFNIAHTDGMRFRFDPGATGVEDNTQFYPFASEEGLCILTHHFDGRLEWFEGRLDRLFDPSPQRQRLKNRITWTGHRSEIKKIVRSATGKALISRTAENESIVWKRYHTEAGDTIARKSIIDKTEHIHRVWLLQEGRFVAFLHHGSISLWDARQSKAVQVARYPYELQGKPLCLLCIPEEHEDKRHVHLATITSEMKGCAWEVTLPTNGDPNDTVELTDFGAFDLGTDNDLAYVLPVDPAGTAPVISGFLDLFARDVAISYSKAGVLKSWTARPNVEQKKLEWLQTSTVETLIENPSLGSATSIRKAALVSADKTLLTIWNTRSAQLEHEEQFEEYDTIQDLDWLSTPDNQSILAVGFPRRVIVYVQLRYDYVDARPSWAPLREFSIRDLTPHPIGDSVWLGNGGFVIGAGNQLFVQEQKIDVSDHIMPDLRLLSNDKRGFDLFTVVSRLNGPLPVFHPQFLSQCILSGRLLLAQKILLKLWKTMKFYSDGEPFDSLLGFDLEDFAQDEDLTASAAKKEMHSSYAEFIDEEPETITEDVAVALNEQLATRTVPFLSSRDQIHLVDIVECVATVEKHRRSLDNNGSRFLLFFRQHVLRSSQRSEHSPLSWREITWAFYSGSQDILADLVSRHFHGRMLWEHARDSGMFMWMTDLTALRQQFEVIARNEYTKSDEKNPVDCSLYYMALKKKAVLVGLWRMATWHKEQSSTHRFLSNNFDEQRWKTAALKNAYALMGKRRFEYAAAFFLLAGALKDAVRVLSHQLGDMQLAIAVARVYEGDNGPVLEEYLKQHVLPLAATEGNRWMANWALWMLGKRDKAVRALILPLDSLLSPPETPNLQSKLFLTDDPALVVLYKQLREKSLQTLRGALSVSPRAEWEFITHTAGLYERMGCDLLALDLVRSWEFLIPQPQISVPKIPVVKQPSIAEVVLREKDIGPKSQIYFNPPPSALDGFDIDPKRLLRRRSSLVVADLPLSPTVDHHKKPSLADGSAIFEDEKETNEIQTNGFRNMKDKKKDEDDDKKKQKPPPTQFVEPDANSLLDSFGF
ncbi:hypothetical protein, variant [Verruconis gallopava]|nr:hypothetical protein, variant [Verruconis gallopava]KIW04001.1 hypothetical protein, variant [Verruconis gallopava]